MPARLLNKPLMPARQEVKDFVQAAGLGGNAAAVMAFLNKYGAAFIDENNDNCTALSSAVMHGRYDIAALLLEKGAKTEVKNKLGWTALIKAAMSGGEEIVMLLLDHGACINAQDKEGNTALMWAERYGHREVVAALLEKGAELDIRDNTGKTVMERVQTNEAHEDIDVMLQQHMEENAQKKQKQKQDASDRFRSHIRKLKSRCPGVSPFTKKTGE